MCRVYLKVLSVTGIITGSGSEIDINYLKGNIHQGGEYQDLQWTSQGEPSANDWTTWRRVLNIILCNGNNTRLLIGLGG